MELPIKSPQQKKLGFTLIELLIVIAILGILAAAVMVAINPRKRLAQSRDAQRKSQVNGIANALVSFYTIRGYYPGERQCDTSRGSEGGFSEDGASSLQCYGTLADTGCPSNDDWCFTYNSPLIAEQLVENEQFLKNMPKDPKNDNTYYYRYEPSSDSGLSCLSLIVVPCTKYWIGVRLESVDDPSEQGKRVFRCSDDTSLAAGVGCKEVVFPVATGSGPPGPGSFDRNKATL